MTETPQDPAGVEEAETIDQGAVDGKVPGRDGGPVDEADMRAAEGLQAPEHTKRAYDEMLERGKNQRGEGRIG